MHGRRTSTLHCALVGQHGVRTLHFTQPVVVVHASTRGRTWAQNPSWGSCSCLGPGTPGFLQETPPFCPRSPTIARSDEAAEQPLGVADGHLDLLKDPDVLDLVNWLLKAPNGGRDHERFNTVGKALLPQPALSACEVLDLCCCLSLLILQTCLALMVGQGRAPARVAPCSPQHPTPTHLACAADPGGLPFRTRHLTCDPTS